ncbi:heparin lyase I family protein [Catenovulum agarivorans]|uniref:heparin lyase I family protein n=1 Tax=Catenovulum agarivorans TaxID=1172192 RepID=UPI0002E2EAB0|nr:heparin lyase I family protein [Catenovulum agarivorans]
MYIRKILSLTTTMLLTACGGGESGTTEEKPVNTQGELTLTGNVVYGETLTANLSDADGLSNLSAVVYQWKRDGVLITGATTKQYQIQKDDINKKIQVSVQYQDDKGFNNQVSSSQSATVPLVNFQGEVTINGTALQGDTLSLVLTDDNNGVVENSVVVAWYADNNLIAEQTATNLLLTVEQVGKKISAQVNYTDGHGFNESLSSAQTTQILAIENSLGSLTLTDGNGAGAIFQQGNTITAQLTDANTVTGMVDYYWYLDDLLIADNNQASYTLLAADVGKHLYVKAVYVDGDGFAEDVLSLTSDAISEKLIGVPGGQNFPIGNTVVGNNPYNRTTLRVNESFEGGGWNAISTPGTYQPGLDTSLPKSFAFGQMQGPHSFFAEPTLTRFGNYSAKLHWVHGDPAKWNGDPKVLDNVDRKAMFHGRNASSILATLWYGFSVYFPKDGTKLSGSEQALFFQIHGAADRADGEPSRIPPLALNIATEGFNVGYSWDSAKLSTSTQGEGNESFNVAVDFADYQDRWVDVVIQVKTDPFEPKGFIKIWFDGVQMVDRQNIQIGYNDDKGLYPSWGWYLWGSNSERSYDAILYMDELRQVEGADVSYYDAAPGYFDKDGINK